MDATTREHLTNALENRDFARALLEPSEFGVVAVRWAVVVGFYAAVHYVNAYVWERLRIEPGNHQERGAFISRIADLQPMRRHYIRLQTTAFDARYSAVYRPSSVVVRDLVETDLETVRVAVLRALDIVPDES